MADDSVVSTREAARLLGVSVRTAQLWVESGVLKAWKTAGNHRRIYRSSVEQLIRERSAQPPKVLVVEDDLTVQAYYGSLFELVEPQVRLAFANNGYEGLLKAGAEHPDLMIVDVDMPRMNGLQMIRSVRETGALGPERIVIVTALSSDEVAARGGVPAGVPLYTKPLSIAAFREILAQLPGAPRLAGSRNKTSDMTVESGT